MFRKTPLVTIREDLFLIVDAFGTQIPFSDMEPPPSAPDVMMVMEAGETRSAVADLTCSYLLPEDGTYFISLRMLNASLYPGTSMYNISSPIVMTFSNTKELSSCGSPQFDTEATDNSADGSQADTQATDNGADGSLADMQAADNIIQDSTMQDNNMKVADTIYGESQVEIQVPSPPVQEEISLSWETSTSTDAAYNQTNHSPTITTPRYNNHYDMATLIGPTLITLTHTHCRHTLTPLASFPH
jgi:hypothetical protein